VGSYFLSICLRSRYPWETKKSSSWEFLVSMLVMLWVKNLTIEYLTLLCWDKHVITPNPSCHSHLLQVYMKEMTVFLTIYSDFKFMLEKTCIIPVGIRTFVSWIIDTAFCLTLSLTVSTGYFSGTNQMEGISRSLGSTGIHLCINIIKVERYIKNGAVRTTK
jgi:hypothetical protein